MGFYVVNKAISTFIDQLLNTNANQNVLFSTDLQLFGFFFVQLATLSTESQLIWTTYFDPEDTTKQLSTTHLQFHKVCHFIAHFLPVLPVDCINITFCMEKTILHALVGCCNFLSKKALAFKMNKFYFFTIGIDSPKNFWSLATLWLCRTYSEYCVPYFSIKQYCHLSISWHWQSLDRLMKIAYFSSLNNMLYT